MTGTIATSDLLDLSTPCTISPGLLWTSPALPAIGSAAEIYDSYWRMDPDWVEKPNRRRGGWSGVSRHVLSNGITVYLKRQENHCYRNPWRLGCLTPTFRREWKATVTLARLGVPVPEVLLYAERRVGDQRQAMIMTRALDNCRTLSDCLSEAGQDVSVRRHLVEGAARILVQLHRTGIQHSCMAGKHLLYRQNPPGNWEVYLLDLEKARRFPLRARAAVRDISGLLQYTPELTPEERSHLVSVYSSGWNPCRNLPLQDAIARRLQRRGCPKLARGLEKKA